MTTIEVNPEIIAAGNEARRRAIRREMRELLIELRSLTPKLSEVLDSRD